ncbi:MAG: CotH kinase family protein [Saprospiraceae bacterium]|nr:CotH kinase family protein [Saprospiraceae bacterium]
MNIKETGKTSHPILQTRLFEKTKPLLLGVLGIVLSTMLFFAILGYGAYLNRIGESSQYKHALVRVAEGDFSFVKNYAKGKFTTLDKMDIDIKFKHMMRIQYLREQAVMNDGKYIADSLKNETFPAKLTYDGEKYNVKISLTGKMVTPHLQNPNHWSFQVKLKGDKTIDGMRRFGMLVPKSRGHLTDWLGLKLMEKRGLITMRSDFKDVSINGKSIGIYYMEERFDKHLLENNQRKEGIIFKIEEDLNIYQEKKLMLAPDTRSQVILLRQMWQNVATGKLPATQFFDIEKMAKLYAIADLMNSRHPLLRDNMRFYFNPISGLVEPIAREFEDLKDSELSDMSLFLEKPKTGRWHHWVKNDKILQKIFNNLHFEKAYIAEAEFLSQEEFLDDFFVSYEDNLEELMSGIYRDWSFYELPKYKLYEHQDYMRKTLHSGITGLSAYFLKKENKNLQLEIANQQFLPIEITNVSWRDSIFFYPKKSIVLAGKKESENEKVKRFAFQISENIEWEDSFLPELKINYNYLGMEKGLKNALVFPFSRNVASPKFNNPIVRKSNYEKFDFIQRVEDKIFIPEGKWILSTDLVIPKDTRFEIEAGAKIDMIQQAKIISYAPVFFNGTASNPIVINSSDATSEGIVIMRAKKRSKLSHTLFDQLSRPEEVGWRLSGAITFFESPVDISNCVFSKNIIGDDFLNIVRTDFSMKNSQFKDILSDAFDCDFCNGKVTDTKFMTIGNDGIDVSGTELIVENVFMDGIGDKGLSAGENSSMTVTNVEIHNAEIAITSKDQSIIYITKSKVKDSRIGMALFQKKPEFGPGFIEATHMDMGKSEIDFLVEKKSKLTMDGKLIAHNNAKAKQILCGAEYGKSSK